MQDVASGWHRRKSTFGSVWSALEGIEAHLRSEEVNNEEIITRLRDRLPLEFLSLTVPINIQFKTQYRSEAYLMAQMHDLLVLSSGSANRASAVSVSIDGGRYQLAVNFYPQILTLFKEERNLLSLGFQGPAQSGSTCMLVAEYQNKSQRIIGKG